jgi:hypothetical protein
VNEFPFDIESRQFLGVKDDIRSVYRRDYIDFANPPVQRGAKRPQTSASLPSWESYRPEKVTATDQNPFNFAVRGPVTDRISTIYRDNFVDFIDRQTIRTLDD